MQITQMYKPVDIVELDFYNAFEIPRDLSENAYFTGRYGDYPEITDKLILDLLGIICGTEWGIDFFYTRKELTRNEIRQAVLKECIESKEQLEEKIKKLFIREVTKQC